MEGQFAFHGERSIEMTKRIGKIAAMAAAIVLILGLLWFGETLAGNPISKNLAQKAAQKHLETVYPGTDFVLEEVEYSFKDGGYYADVISPSSEDSTFTLAFNHWGKFRWDSYEDRVVHRENTARRVEKEYWQLADQVLSQMESYDPEGIQHGKLELNCRKALEFGDGRPYSMAFEELELDRVYDVGELGAQCGTVVYYVDTENLTAEYAAQLMLEIRRLMDQAGVGFRGLDLVLQEPVKENEPRDTGLQVEAFPYEDIFEEGLEERIMEAYSQWEERYAELNREKTAEYNKANQ